MLAKQHGGQHEGQEHHLLGLFRLILWNVDLIMLDVTGECGLDVTLHAACLLEQLGGSLHLHLQPTVKAQQPADCMGTAVTADCAGTALTEPSVQNSTASEQGPAKTVKGCKLQLVASYAGKRLTSM